MDWDDSINLPSVQQSENIDIILDDRREKIERIVDREIVIIPYSAKTRYNLQELFTAIVKSSPPTRAWIFSDLKNFRYDDFIPDPLLNPSNDWEKPERKVDSSANQLTGDFEQVSIEKAQLWPRWLPSIFRKLYKFLFRA
jgi:predicted GTPase